MIDLHCHILSGIDDGAQSMEDSLEMARAAVSEGMTHIIATPHHMRQHWINDKETVIKLVSELQIELDSEEIPLIVFPGQEIRIYGEILKDIEKGKIQFIDEQEQYLLIEFPSTSIPTFTERLFYDMQSGGITPIIVHPERNNVIQEDPNKLKELVDKGALTQLTAGSYTGGFGKKIMKLSKQLIEADLIHIIASDAHNVTSRPFLMKEAYEKLENEFGPALRDRFIQNTKDLVNGEVIIPPTPKSVGTRKFFGLF